MSGADLTLEFLEGGGAANAGAARSSCPYLATSNAADAWHAGHYFHSRGRVNDIAEVTKGRGARLNLFHVDGRDKFVATVNWNVASDDDQPLVTLDEWRDWSPAMKAARLERCYCDECCKLDRKRLQGIPGTFQARLEIGCGTHHAPAAAPAAPTAAAVDDLPLFIGSLEPTLF